MTLRRSLLRLRRPDNGRCPGHPRIALHDTTAAQPCVAPGDNRRPRSSNRTQRQRVAPGDTPAARSTVDRGCRARDTPRSWNRTQGRVAPGDTPATSPNELGRGRESRERRGPESDPTYGRGVSLNPGGRLRRLADRNPGGERRSIRPEDAAERQGPAQQQRRTDRFAEEPDPPGDGQDRAGVVERRDLAGVEPPHRQVLERQAEDRDEERQVRQARPGRRRGGGERRPARQRRPGPPAGAARPRPGTSPPARATPRGGR